MYYYILFFLSGFPALIYQIVWQRSLFTIYGVNVESVTVIVTAFMLGLGFGSLAGGRLSSRSRLPLLGVFGAIEIGIGLFGAVSLVLFHRVGIVTAGASAPITGVITIGLLLIPTMLMGSTLPLLAAHFVRVNGNVGESVGMLYFVNTCGSALACVVAALFMMRVLGQSGSVYAAAILNGLVGSSALLLQRFRTTNARRDEDAGESTRADLVRTPSIAFPVGLVLAAAAGFVSLGYEIVWYRVYAFATGDAAPAFAWLLGAYLGGIALGSLGVRGLSRLVQLGPPRLAADALSALFAWAAVVSFLVAPAVALMLQHTSYGPTLILVGAGAALLGAAFPLVSHVAIDPAGRAGRQLSYVYLANILGSAAGSFLVGFLLMDIWPLGTIALFLLACAVLPALLLLPGSSGLARRVALAGLGVAALAGVLSTRIYADFYEQLMYKNGKASVERFTHLIETRSGVIAVDDDGTVYGGGEYDGRFNVDLVDDPNVIFRAYVATALHPRPSEVLMVGLSSGSWAQVVANSPDVAHLTIIEINPGYLQLIPQYPAVASLLTNPKVTIVIDDGRRWLLRNPGRMFDLSVMNTRINWRAHASNVLSVEFLELVRRHLAPGGIHYYNTTFSGDALLTGVTVFPYALRVGNFLAVGDSPIRLDRTRWESVLSRYQIDGKLVLDRRVEGQRAVFDRLMPLSTLSKADVPVGEMMSTEDGDSLRRRLRASRPITDDNMGTEWR